MNNKLTQDQLAQVVAEVERLSQRREAELNREEVNQILQELSLPPDLLDDALVQVERRQALEVQQKRNRWIGISIAAVLVGIIAIVTQPAAATAKLALAGCNKLPPLNL